MSDVKGSFDFILRGTDSLAYKWINEERRSGAVATGVNIWGLADYFFKNFSLNKMFSDIYSDYNDFAGELKNLNQFDAEHVIGFSDIVKIPITHKLVEVGKGSVGGFGELADKFLEMRISATSQLKDILSKEETLELLVNTYHTFYDVRAREGISGKTYREIQEHPFLYFGTHSVLFFLLPATIVENVVVSTSREDNRTIELRSNSTTPEVNEVKKIVFLDPGHGGTDSGNIGINMDWTRLSIRNYAELSSYYTNNTLVKESRINMEFATKLKALLEAAEIIVEMTRTSDTDTELSERTKYVNDKLKTYKDEDKKLFLSLHTNAVGEANKQTIDDANITYLTSGNIYYYAYTSAPQTNTWVPVPRTAPSGAHVYKYNNADPKYTVHEESTSLRDKLADTLGAEKKEANYAVIRETTAIPGVLIELGFSTNLNDLKNLIDSSKQDAVCTKIKDAIVEFFQ